MKITKKETYNKNKSAGINEKLISEYYDIIPHMENEIENLLKKFNVKKYDHKITTLLIDIIQNETLKILLSSKKIQKRTKANAKTNSDQPDFDKKNQDNQNNIPNQAPNTTSQEIEKKETIDDSPNHPNDEPNYIFKADSYDQKNEGSQNSPNIDNLIQPEHVESISKNAQSASEENVENNKNDQSKENEMEKNSEETQTKEEETSGGLFKKISSFFSKKDNEEEKKQEDSEKIEDPSKDTKLNTDNNSIQNEKENLVNDTIQLDDLKSDEKNEEKSSLLASNDKLGETQEMETTKDNSNNNNDNKIENAENINEKNNASEENLDKINYDGTEQPNKNDDNKKNNNNENNNANEQEEAEEDVLIIDEESVNQAIREYALKYIYRKKNVDFVYDDPTYEQKDINNVFIDRNIKYPMGFPPHLPDDCSINTILPSWNIQYDFTKKNKNNQYRQ
ncbi:conserved Plasmodium protein, unknown function [Plasmodium vinckei brucechwatti]|uniref:Uncharacterized protein n=1 Tax=Plasmodium vinckei brucechwatti TaxID=119398 RepID=A0A6V7RYK7_PLAVN|nr:conserved Plasmodium protein, unknown function [Plasmodium vinckei brucechwatti]